MQTQDPKEKDDKLAKPDSQQFRAYLVQKKRKKRNAEVVV